MLVIKLFLGYCFNKLKSALLVNDNTLDDGFKAGGMASILGCLSHTSVKKASNCFEKIAEQFSIDALNYFEKTFITGPDLSSKLDALGKGTLTMRQVYMALLRCTIESVVTAQSGMLFAELSCS
jgi:hypothetical protein